MTILSILALAIMVIAVLAAVFTDVHPTVFYSAWLFALGLMAFRDGWDGHWWWQFALDMVLVALAGWSWRKELQAVRRKAAKA